MHISHKFLFIITPLFVFSSLQAQIKYIHCGRLIDGISNEAKTEMTLVIENNKISQILKGYQTPPQEATLIDLKDQTVLPGLMDMHVHIESQQSPQTYTERYTLNKEDVAFRAAKYAKITLMSGFTTVRDLGGSGVNIALRKAVDAGWTVGPRIYTAGKSIAPTGGHADPTNGYRNDLMGDPGPELGVINGTDDCRKAVRHQLKLGADLIKITATGGVLSVAKDGFRPQFTEEEIKAIVETCNDLGITTAAHAHGPEGMKRAIRAGITSIEHGTLMDDEVIALMKQYGTYYVPTISAGEYVAEQAKIPGRFPDVIVPKALSIGPQIRQTFAKAYKAGVKIAFGTDTGVSAHGDNAKEFGFMVSAGMPPMLAIKSATMEAAKLLRIENTLGSIEQGKLADIVGVKGNPLDQITVLENISFVMKDGKMYKLNGKEVME
ncbi:MAG: amidohydrolase family protein [Microscillaceae bacterium]|nr:amidohydrolase family protein [Microscillaceae bacterium]